MALPYETLMVVRWSHMVVTMVLRWSHFILTLTLGMFCTPDPP